MLRRVIALCLLGFITTACSRSPERATALSPTAPSASIAAGDVALTAGVSGPMEAVFPSRSDAFEFRNQLEAKYQALNRPVQQTFVNREGEVVWTQEYLRYRANGCDHSTAVARVLSQIAGNPAGAICSAPPTTSAVSFPPRQDTFEFRRQLETTYAQLNVAATATLVDVEGSAVWLQEYLRYRTNACDHASAVEKVFAQIDGGPVAATCFVAPVEACLYRVGLLFQDVPSTGGAFFANLHRLSGACIWTATTSASWITLVAPTTGDGSFGRVDFTAATNPGAQRTGRITFTYAGTTATHEVIQGSSPYTVFFRMVDSWRSSAQATECWIVSSATPCTLTASADLPGAQTYAWRIGYTYGTDKTLTQTSASNTFVLTEGCGGANSTTDGFVIDLDVTMTVRDDRGNEVTIRSGQGTQSPLRLKVFRC